MYISYAESCAKGFKKWSNSHQIRSNDGAVVDALSMADSGMEYPALMSAEAPRGAWLVPGVGNTF